MPLHDWQFWVVTLLMLVGLWLVWRTLMPKRMLSKGDTPGCPTCTSNSPTSRLKRRVMLTIDRRRVR